MISADTARQFMKETPLDAGLAFRILHAAKNGETGVSYAATTAREADTVRTLREQGFTVTKTDENDGYAFLYIRWNA